MPTDTSEKGLEALIVASLVEEAGYVQGKAQDYNREHAVDLAKLLRFLAATQPEACKSLDIGTEGASRTKFLHRLQGEVTKRGVVELLRRGIEHGPVHLDLFYGRPTPGNVDAAKRHKSNIFSVTRQLRYSLSEAALALDLAIFINGLPIATFELKNNLTKQTVHDAVLQYKRDRDPKEPLFQFKRCMAHFAVDDREVRFCTRLQGKGSWFLPFNKGYQDGAGNPPNPDGIATDYLWKQTLAKPSLTDILENYAQVVAEQDERAGKKKRETQVFPRYHQLTVVRALLADASKAGVGKRYLVPHSAGSGKSNSIAWLAHQLVGLEPEGKALFDSVIVVTDRRVLDRQISATIRQFAQVAAILDHAENAADLRRLLAAGKKIIISTVQKFQYLHDAVGSDHPDRSFAIIIDEAHSSQGGKAASAMNTALHGGEAGPDEEETVEDKINKIMEGRKMLKNASYFAFTATPKNKTLEIFGTPAPQAGGKVKHHAFHTYTMKQAIQEGFILDVLAHYTPVNSFYRLIKTVAGDPQFDRKKAQKKLRRYVESNQDAIRKKAAIMVDHFHESVIGAHKLGGEARAMVVTSGVAQAIEYFAAFQDCLRERKSPFEAIVAFSGDREVGGATVNEAKLNNFPSTDITQKIQQDPYRFLIVADKYQTGYDEPLLHTLYADKMLTGIKAVQTLSRLNRAHPKKRDTFVLDFHNDSDTIKKAFEPYYRGTILSDETDPNKLHDLKATLDAHQVYAGTAVDEFVTLYLGGAARERLDPILDECVRLYRETLDENQQVEFKGRAKAFIRTYNFLGAILPDLYPDWERLSIFLAFLTPKLPAPIEDDLSQGILEAIDMESYRAEASASLNIALADEDSEIDPFHGGGGGGKPEPDPDRLSNILREFHELFGNIDWKDEDRIRKIITEELPAMVSKDKAYQNAMKNNDRKTARIEHGAALGRAALSILQDPTEFYKQYSDSPSFRKWLADTIFTLTYQPP